MVNKENTSLEIKNAKTDIALIPVGATEQHASHLPVKTDAFLAEKVCEEVAKETGAYVLPAMPFGNSIENMEGAGTVTLRPMTLRAVIFDLTESLFRQGYKKIFVVNFHGANFVLKPTVREINYEGKFNGKVFYVDSAYGKFEGAKMDLHSGDVETSMMMYLWKKKLSLKNVKNVSPVYKRADLDWVGMVSATGGAGCWGFPLNATLKKGKKEFENRVAFVVKEINRILGLYNNIK